jgi:hypothetical protein
MRGEITKAAGNECSWRPSDYVLLTVHVLLTVLSPRRVSLARITLGTIKHHRSLGFVRKKSATKVSVCAACAWSYSAIADLTAFVAPVQAAFLAQKKARRPEEAAGTKGEAKSGKRFNI